MRRLYSIVALRGLGFSLAEVAELLGEGVDPKEATRRRLTELDRQLAAGGKLRRRLAGLLDALDHGDEGSPERLIELVEEMTMHEK